MNKLPFCTIHLPIRGLCEARLGAVVECNGPPEILGAARRALRRAAGRVIYRSFPCPQGGTKRYALVETDLRVEDLTQLLLDYFEDVRVVGPAGPGQVELRNADGHSWVGRLTEYLGMENWGENRNAGP